VSYGSASSRIANMDRRILDGQITTVSGRKIVVPPPIRLESNRKATIDLKNRERWLLREGIAEAEARGDRFNVTQFGGLNPEALSPSDKDSLSLYLFGEETATFYVGEPTPARTAPGTQQEDLKCQT
jgi:hypothetical protein